jgi:hypothetical protein
LNIKPSEKKPEPEAKSPAMINKSASMGGGGMNIAALAAEKLKQVER